MNKKISYRNLNENKLLYILETKWPSYLKIKK